MPWRSSSGGSRAGATPGARGAGSARATPPSRLHVSPQTHQHYYSVVVAPTFKYVSEDERWP